MGGQLRYFGDGYQASKVLGGTRYWRVPVMEGEFLVQERFGIGEGVAGGNILMLGADAPAALRRRRPPPRPCGAIEGVILPFPGGIARSGSKVGSRYEALMASTNDKLCPTLRAQVPETDVPDGVGSVLEIVIDGLGIEPVRRAMAVGLEAAARAGAAYITAGQLRREPRPAPHPPARARRHGGRRVTLTLTLRDAPAVALEADTLRPDRVAGLGPRRGRAPRGVARQRAGAGRGLLRGRPHGLRPGRLPGLRPHRGRPAQGEVPRRRDGRRAPGDRRRRRHARGRGHDRRGARDRGGRRRLRRGRRCTGGGSSCTARPAGTSAASCPARARACAAARSWCTATPAPRRAPACAAG